MKISREEAKNLTLEHLNWWMTQLPVAQRTAPTISFDFKAWSIPEMIVQVRNDTLIGQRYVNFYIGSLGQYVIQG